MRPQLVWPVWANHRTSRYNVTHISILYDIFRRNLSICNASSISKVRLHKKSRCHKPNSLNWAIYICFEVEPQRWIRFCFPNRSIPLFFGWHIFLQTCDRYVKWNMIPTPIDSKQNDFTASSTIRNVRQKQSTAN